jgi:hypothetical protein
MKNLLEVADKRLKNKTTKKRLDAQAFNFDDLYKLAEGIRKRIIPVVTIHELIFEELHPGVRYEEY